MASKQQRRPIKTFRGGFLLCDLYLNINDIKGKALSRNFSIYFDWSTFVFTQIIRTSQVRTVLRKQKIQLFRKYKTKFFGIVETEPYATICTWSQHGGIMESKVKKKTFNAPPLTYWSYKSIVSDNCTKAHPVDVKVIFQRSIWLMMYFKCIKNIVRWYINGSLHGPLG